MAGLAWATRPEKVAIGRLLFAPLQVFTALIVFLALLGICLAVLIPLSLVIYSSETSSSSQRVATIAGAASKSWWR